MQTSLLPAAKAAARAPVRGARGRLVLCAAIILAGMLTPPNRLPWVAVVCVVLSQVILPSAVGRLFSARRLLMLLFLAVPPLLLGLRLDGHAGLAISAQQAQLSFIIAARIVVFLVALNGLAQHIAPTALADLIEGAGMRGLGFAFGVALNMLPALRTAGATSWHALRMRGGLRRQWFVAVRLLSVTILTSALRRAEEIALAADARGFDPASRRPAQLGRGQWDPLTYALAAVLLLLALAPGSVGA